MKRFIIAIVLILVFGLQSYACEICGCSHSNFQIGLLPAFNKGFAGIRYSTSRFTSAVRNEPSEFSRDYYQAVELWGGYNYKRLQVMLFAPYLLTEKDTDDGLVRSNGMGDVMLLLNYNILGANSISKNERTTVRNELYVGGGIKLPTGVNTVDPADPEFNVGDFNSQAGTGSVDYLVTATYNFLWNNSGIVTNAAYLINTGNADGYRFGNRAYLNSAYFYTFTKGEMKIRPNAGASYQTNAMNSFDGAHVEDSEGYTLNSTAGINVLRRKIGVNAMAFIPVSQNNFDGQTRLKSRFLFGITYSI
jgi:hypothetical protein